MPRTSAVVVVWWELNHLTFILHDQTSGHKLSGCLVAAIRWDWLTRRIGPSWFAPSSDQAFMYMRVVIYPCRRIQVLNARQTSGTADREFHNH